MFSKRVILIAVVLVCILALTAAVIVQAQNAQRQGPRDGAGRPDARPRVDAPPCPVRVFGPPPPPQMQRIMTELQLTEEQRRQATALVGRLDAKIKEITGDKNLMRDLLAEFKAEPTNREKTLELGRQIARQEGEVFQADLAMWLEFEQVLTPEQRTKFWAEFPFRGGPAGPPPGGPRVPGQPPVVPGS